MKRGLLIASQPASCRMKSTKGQEKRKRKGGTKEGGRVYYWNITGSSLPYIPSHLDLTALGKTNRSIRSATRKRRVEGRP